MVDCIVMTDRMTGRSRGFGFITMADQAGYDRVMSAPKQAHVLGAHGCDSDTTEPRAGGWSLSHLPSFAQQRIPRKLE